MMTQNDAQDDDYFIAFAYTLRAQGLLVIISYSTYTNDHQSKILTYFVNEKQLITKNKFVVHLRHLQTELIQFAIYALHCDVCSMLLFKASTHSKIKFQKEKVNSTKRSKTNSQYLPYSGSQQIRETR